MAIDISTLTDVERQALADALHKAKVFPSNLNGSGSPAHIQAVTANLNDLRGALQMEYAAMARLLQILSPTQAVRQSPAPGPDSLSDNDQP